MATQRTSPDESITIPDWIPGVMWFGSFLALSTVSVVLIIKDAGFWSFVPFGGAMSVSGYGFNIKAWTLSYYERSPVIQSPTPRFFTITVCQVLASMSWGVVAAAVLASLLILVIYDGAGFILVLLLGLGLSIVADRLDAIIWRRSHGQQ